MNKFVVIIVMLLMVNTVVNIQATGGIRGKHIMRAVPLSTTGVLSNGTLQPLNFNLVYSTDDTKWYTEAAKDLRMELQCLTNWSETIYVEIFWFECVTYDNSNKDENGLVYYQDGYWCESTIASPYIDLTHDYQSHINLPSARYSEIIVTRYGGGSYSLEFDGTIICIEITLLIGNGSHNYQRMLFDRFLVMDNTDFANNAAISTVNANIENRSALSIESFFIGLIIVTVCYRLYRKR